MRRIAPEKIRNPSDRRSAGREIMSIFAATAYSKENYQITLVTESTGRK